MSSFFYTATTRPTRQPKMPVHIIRPRTGRLILALISGEVTMIHAMRFGLGVLILLGCTPLTTADPATQPSTQPLGAAMVRCVDKKVGVAFDRPAGWENDDTPPPNGTARVSFAEPEPWDGGVRAYV